jgi:hypothetical protein
MGLSARHLARLEILTPLAKRGRLAPDSAEAREYASLKEAEARGVDPMEEVPVAAAPVATMLAIGTVVEQAQFYGVSKRTINVWRGKNAPLGRPAEMVGWWSKAFPGQAINPKIISALARTGGVVPTVADVALPPKAAAGPAREVPPSLPSAPSEIDGEIGFDATHRRMLEEEVRLFERIKWLESKGRQEEADTLRPAWLNLSTSLGSADTRQIRNALQRGDLIPGSLVEKEYASLIVHHPEVLRSELKEMRTLMEPLPPAHVWDPQIDRLVDSLFRAMPEKLLARAAAA